MPEQKSVFRQKPQINISYSSNGRMWVIFACAFLCVLQSAFFDGGLSLIPAFASLFTALASELILTCRKDGFKKITNGSASATAMILCLMLPNTVHPVYVIFGSAFAIVVVKYTFGGLGANWFNPALGGWLFIRFSWPDVFKEFSSSSISNLDVSPRISALDNSVTEFLNNTVFSIPGVQLPSGYIDLLFNNNPGLIADRGLFCLLIGSIIITAAVINRPWLPFVFLAVFGFLVHFAGDIGNIFWNGDIIYGIFSGGTIAAAFIISAEPSSSAKMKTGILLTVILAAVLSWFFRYIRLDYTGCFAALALINCFTPFIKLIEEKYFLSRSGKAV